MRKAKPSIQAILLTCTAAGALSLGLAGTAYAQDTGEEQVAEDTPQGIVVTGSRIRGIDPVGSNVIALDQERIEEEPVNSTNELLRRVPQVVSLGANRAGGSAQNGAANATRGAGINLRGLSTNATLLLHDGYRFPPQGTQGQFTDPSVIPSIALGRVEVVADGASAIYGSDAIAGVVNLITRKDFTGFEARARYGFTDGDYAEKQIAAIGGVQWDGGYATLSGEYTDFSALYGSQLDFFQLDNSDRGGRDLRSVFCNPGTITANGQTYAIPEGGVTPANAGSLVAGTRNLCDYTGLSAVIPEQERWSIAGNASQEVVPGVRIFVDGFWSRREGVIPGPADFTAVVPSTNPFFVSPVPASSVQVTYSLTPEIGYLENPYYSWSYDVVGGVEVDLFGDFQATGYYSYGKSAEVAQRTRGVSGGAVAAALADTDPDTALNVFGGANNPATLDAITDRLFFITGRTRLEVANLQADGSLFELPGGAVRIAVGGEHRVEYTYTDLAIGSSASFANVTDAGSRNVDALFGELYVPVVGSGNASPGLERLAVSLALRHENYSDFGSTTNPKVGVTYQPFAGVTLKGTYGTSFRAPTFTEVSTVGGGAGLYFDTLPGPNGNQIGIGIAGGNPDLKPETAETWSFGLDLAPVAIPGFRLNLNYFDINYTDQIQALRGTPGLLTNPLYATFVRFNPTMAEIEALMNSGLPINAPINPDQVTFIADGRRHNLGTSELRGVDFVVNYEWELGEVEFDAGLLGTYVLDYKFEPVPGAGLTDVLGDIGFTQKFRSQATIGAEWNRLRGRATWNHLSGYENVTVEPVQRIGDYDTVDLYVGYDLTDHVTLSADVRNLFDEDPPFVDITGGYDPQASNPVPRLISVGAAVKF